MNFPELRLALAARLSTVEPPPRQQKPQVFSKLKSQITPPTLMVGYPERVDFHHQSQGGAQYDVVIFGIGAAGVYDEVAQEMVDHWLSTEGPTSVSAALEADPSLGGIAEDVTVVPSEGYAVYTIANVAYLGVEWKVEILG